MRYFGIHSGLINGEGRADERGVVVVVKGEGETLAPARLTTPQPHSAPAVIKNLNTFYANLHCPHVNWLPWVGDNRRSSHIILEESGSQGLTKPLVVVAEVAGLQASI